MKSPPRELEIKFELPAGQLRRLKNAPVEGTTDVSPASTQTLTSTYYDTSSRSLREKGYSLRVRHADGKWIQTVKADRGIRGGVSSPIEIEIETAGSRPDLDAIADKDIRREIENLTAGSRLVPLFDTEIKRTSRHLETKSGDRIELSIDEGHVVTRVGRKGAKSRTSAIREVELELKSGFLDGLLEALEKITEQSAFRLCSEGKADVGYHLVDGTSQFPQVTKARTPTIDNTMSSRDAVRHIIESTTAQVLANWLVVLDRDDPEGVHQMRVGLRRSRSALRILRYLLDEQTLRGLDDELRDLARAAGELRDLDVLATDILDPLAAADQFTSGVDKIRKRLQAERQQAREKLIKRLEERRSEILRLRLGLLPQMFDRLAEGSALDQPAEHLASVALTKLIKRALKRGKDIENATVEQRHELRKALKTIRYASEFFGPALPDSKLSKIAKCSAELQDLLGYHNDVALAGRLATLASGKATQGKDVDLAVGAIIGWHSARDAEALQHIAGAWKRWKKLAKGFP